MLAGLAACAPGGMEGSREAGPRPVYGDIEAAALDDTLVRIGLSMTGAGARGDVEAYVDCAAAGYTRAHGKGFARNVRTQIDETGGIWTADAIYTISATLPRGGAAIDADVAVRDCKARAIPTT